MAAEHVEQCVKNLNEHLQGSEINGVNLIPRKRLTSGYEAIFELLDLDWEIQTADKADIVFREGYEQCLVDVCEAIAQEWGLALPPDPQRQAVSS